MQEPAIKTTELSKEYRGMFGFGKRFLALDQLTLEVPAGKVFGFLGPNGAGKTTTIRCLMDLIRPTGGKAWVLGKPCGDVDVRGRIGYLPDSPAFSPHLTARQFLIVCARLLRIPKQERNQRVDEVLEDVQMKRAEKQLLSGFSRGMLQRIGIAQALLNKPELLILDEPLVGLDPRGRKDLLNILVTQKEQGTCVFFCSHILSDVEKLCDSVGILNNGRLLCSGRLEELLSSAHGVTVTVPASEEPLARELVLEADDSHRDSAGGWTLQFDGEEKCSTLRQRTFPDTITVTARRENLEDLFFRLTQTHGTA